MSALENSRTTDLVSAVKQNDEQRMSLLLELGVQPDKLDLESGISALHAAIMFAPSLLPVLLSHSTHPDNAVVMGGTALSYVVHELGESPDPARRNSLLEAAGTLLRAGAKPWIRDAD